MSNPWLLIGFMVLAMMFSAFFSSAEMAYTAVSPIRLNHLEKQGHIRAKQALYIATHYDQFSSALLFGNGVVNIFNSAITALLSIQYLAPLLPNPALAASLTAIAIFFVIVIFGELVPKMIGKVHALSLSMGYVIPVYGFRFLFTPFVYLVGLIVLPIRLVFLQKRKENRTRYSDDELETMVDTIEEKGIIDEKKGDLIRSTLSFSEKKAYEVMTPRVDMVGFNLEEDSQHLLLHPDIFGYSRIPVYDQTLDKIVGILPTKKLYKRYLTQTMIDLPSLLIPPLFVPRNQSLSKVMQLFKEQKQQLAIVIDEHGGTEGLITLEDIVEEIVGEIWDETDDILPLIIKQSDTVYLVEGNLNIESFFDEIDRSFEETSDFATVSGWVIYHLGKFAHVGDQFKYQDLHVEVLEVEKFTVEKIKVTLLEQNQIEVKKEND